ncbi:hypothetical protein Tco_0861417 [Tanacetum coccineum]|uniref:Retrovirus-related Pol polyprotein from transposon TNT 1-94 n=1 Tax=Tanacetum coccineum TaxID=301880 RepID=A0ABQ5BHU8_9ASTR
MENKIFFNQSKYIKEMLKKFGLEDSKPTKTPMSTEIKLTKDDEADSVDSSKYQVKSRHKLIKWTTDELKSIYLESIVLDKWMKNLGSLEKRLFHERRIVTPSFITENNMLPFFQAVGLEPFLTLNEPICPRFTFHEHVMDPLDISRNPSKEKGKKIASPLVISSSSSSFDDNEAPYFLKFYDELSDSEDLTKAQ